MALLSAAIRRRRRQLITGEQQEGRWRSDQVEVRARGRYDRLTREETARRKLIESHLDTVYGNFDIILGTFLVNFFAMLC